MADVFGVAYDAYKQNKKAKQERRDRLAGLYAAASTCMESLASSLREGQIPLKRSAEFAIYIDEFNEVLTPRKKRPSSAAAAVAILRRLREEKDHVASSEELTQLRRAFSTGTFLEATSAYILAVMGREQLTPDDQQALNECAKSLERAAGEFVAWAALLRA
jgi:hypothetical protein